MKKLSALATSAAFALLLTTAAAVPANANYAYNLDGPGCDTTITNGVSFGRTSVIGGDCGQKITQIKVQYPGTAAYWTSFVIGFSQIQTSYRPSTSCYVIQSYHSILEMFAYRTLSV